ncbi:MAG: glycosyltransferase family 4 protein [Opitutaceae bacterium]|nr:glycosyltransferase family 4 protein [Opitutaceae bacterium]
MMRVALDTNALYTTRAGVARYVRGMQQGLATLRDADLHVIPWVWTVENFDYAQPQRLLKTAWREGVWARTTGRVRLRSVDLLHSTHLPLLARPSVPQVVTLHDLAVLRHPERFRAWQRHSGVRRLRQLAGADRIIAVSQFTADEAIALLGLSARRISVVHHGVTLAEAEEVPAELPAEFFLFVGSLEPGKNLALLRQVWLAAAAEGKTLPPLLIVGSRWAGVAREGEAPVGWRFLGYQPDEVLLALYRRARALLFPSVYEGFGLPVLEAMAAGCPVICGRVASLPEVGGDAVNYAALNVTGFLAAARHMLSGDALRMGLIAAGRARAALFNWETCARATAAVYRQTLARA